MVVVKVDWQTFQQQFLQQIVFVKEEESTWSFWTTAGLYNVTCSVEKSLDDIENIMFVDRFLNEHKNIIKVIDISPEESPVRQEEVPMDSEESIGFGDNTNPWAEDREVTEDEL